VDVASWADGTTGRRRRGGCPQPLYALDVEPDPVLAELPDPEDPDDPEPDDPGPEPEFDDPEPELDGPEDVDESDFFDESEPFSDAVLAVLELDEPLRLSVR
jgi:hypothetical protein